VERVEQGVQHALPAVADVEIPGYRTGGIWKTLQGVYPTKMNWWCATAARSASGTAIPAPVYQNADTTSAVVAMKPFNSLCIALFGAWRTTRGQAAWFVNFGDVHGWVLDSQLRGF
jgi:hypothetical protein